MNKKSFLFSPQQKEEGVEKIMETAEQTVDRRVQRTRNLLYEALRQLLKEKSFQALTVYEIAERAMVNRGTFYLHFTDKYALLNDYIREEFQQILPARLSASVSLSKENIYQLILTVIDYLAHTYDHCRPVDKPVESILELAVQQEIYQLCLKWLEHSPLDEISLQVSVEPIATVMSWAIFGAGTQWRKSTKTITAEAMAHQVTMVLMNGLLPITPTSFLD